MVALNRKHRTLWVSPDETETMFWGRYAAVRLEIDQKLILLLAVFESQMIFRGIACETILLFRTTNIWTLLQRWN